MTRCPNCGAEVRDGAKFCTSCGFRLTESEAASTPSRSPFAIPPAGAWSPPETAVRSDADSATVDSSRQDVIDETVYEAPVAISTADDPDDVTDLDDNERPGPSWYSPAPVTTSGPVSDEMLAELERESGGGESTENQPESTSESEAPRAPADVEADDEADTSEGASPWDQASAETETSLMPSRVDSGGSGAASGSLDEARQLLTRLQAVLSGLSGDALAGSERSAPDLSVSDDEVDSLRKVVAAAQERPRDVDVMLDLVLRADAIAGVIRDRDALLGKDGEEGGNSQASDDEASSMDPASSPVSSWPTR